MTLADSTHANFESFRNYVLDSPTLQLSLRDIPDWATFLEHVLTLGAANGYTFTADDVTKAMQASRRAWIERWIQ